MRTLGDPRRLRAVPAKAAGWLALAWSGAIFSASSVPGSAVPGRFGSLAHFLEYAILAALIFVALRGDGLADRALAVVALASAYGATDELHQAFVTMRMPDPVDWAVDTAGAIAAAAVFAIVAYRLRRKPQ